MKAFLEKPEYVVLFSTKALFIFFDKYFLTNSVLGQFGFCNLHPVKYRFTNKIESSSVLLIM